MQKLFQAEILSQQCTCCHSHVAFYSVVVPKLPSESSDLQNTDWKILVIIPTQTGQVHVGLIQGVSIHVLSFVRKRKDRVLELQTSSIHQDRRQYFFSVMFLQHIVLHLT